MSISQLASRRTWLVVWLIPALIVASWFSISRLRARRPIPTLGPVTATIVPGLHILSGLGPSAAYVIETTDGLVLVDTGLEADAAPLKAQMAELGLDWRNIRAIFITHVHGDHCGGAQHLRSATGAKVYAGEGDVANLREGGPREAFFSTFHMPHHSPHPTTVDVALKGGEILDFGDTRIRALASPGHTPGSICYEMERKGVRSLFSGDVIMQLGGQKAAGIYSTYLAPRYRGDARAYLKTIAQLRAMPVPDLLLPGHPFSDLRPENPRLSPQRWESLLDDAKRDMDTLIARYDADGADFLDGQPKELLPGLLYLGDLHGEAVYGLFAGERFFLVGAPGGGDLPSFVDARLRSLGHKPMPPTAVLLTSGDERDTAGLAEIVKASHAAVVAPASALEGIGAICPSGTTLVGADELSSRGWFPVQTIPLLGRAADSVGYVIERDGKTVLLSGRIPIMVDHASLEQLSSELARAPGNTLDYLTSIQRLDGVKPDLWLPSSPSDGQNANLYEGEWKEILGNNYRVGYQRLARTAGSPLPRFTPSTPRPREAGPNSPTASRPAPPKAFDAS